MHEWQYGFIVNLWPMRLFCTLICVILTYTATAQTFTLCTWNIQNMGKSKQASQINMMAKTLEQCDLIALQEINTGSDGKQKVVELTTALNKIKKVYFYSVSDATNSDNPHENERYAYIWNGEKVKQQRTFHLDKNFAASIVREPYMGYFAVGKHTFTVVNFHAVPKKKQPQQEIAKFKQFGRYYQKQNLVFLGDLNTPPTDEVFNPLKQKGYDYYPKNQATTLRQDYKPNDQLANPYDHIWWPNNLGKVKKAEIIPFYKSFGSDMKAARKLSDHVPVKITVQL